MPTGPSDRIPKRALGRGLSALIPQASVPVQGELPPSTGVVRIPVERLLRDPAQPRKTFDEAKLGELAESIRTQGVIQPVLVRRDGADYRLIAGERRWRAAQLAGLHEVPAVVRDVTAAEAFELALVENLQRTDLNPLEEAEGYRRLIQEFGLTQDQVGERVGRDRTSVANALRLLQLPGAVKELLVSGALGMGHARALLGMGTGPELVTIAERIVREQLSVRETERIVRTARAPVTGSTRKPAGSTAARAVVEDLQRRLGTKVRLEDRGGKGTLEIDFFSYEDLERILALLRR
ncbi:MAG TPA: ParB/RepB/Spo0J family partition protein [Myxococcaceae bacterium]|nr:ParB/RepB/Spo0J family partition protein [Myxococcaceae bacterium]